MDYESLKKLKIKNENGNKVMWCSYCKRSGHLRNMCYNLRYFCKYCERSGHTEVS